jgi:hypothetical protein
MYCTPEEIRAEGITEEQVTDERLYELCEYAADFVDKVTGQWFEPRELTLTFSGNDTPNLRLPVFLIETTQVLISGEEIADFELPDGVLPEEKTNPYIYRENGWPAGSRNIKITGLWGYCDYKAEGVTPVYGWRPPKEIRKAAKKLVIRELPLFGDIAGQEEKKRGRVISETTDGHSYTLDKTFSGEIITGDLEIDITLNKYMVPIYVGGV